MNVKAIRKKRLKDLIDLRFQGVAARLADVLGMKPPQLHRWLQGGQGMEESSARAIEEKIDGLWPGWLDTLEDDPVAMLQARLKNADSATHALVEIALGDSSTPMPSGLSPSIRTMVDMVRTAINNELNAHRNDA